MKLSRSFFILSHKVLGSGGTVKQRQWKNFMVDQDLKDEWLEAVNKIPYIHVISICSGHPVGNAKAGGDKYPGFNVKKMLHQNIRPASEVLRRTMKPIALKLSKIPNVKVEFQIWAKGTVIYNSEQNKYGQKGYKDLMTELSEIIWTIDSKIPNTGHNDQELNDWWEATIPAVHQIFSTISIKNII